MRCGAALVAAMLIALTFWSPSHAALTNRRPSTATVLAGVAAESALRPTAETGRGLPGGGSQGDARSLEDWAVAAIDAAGAAAAARESSGNPGGGGDERGVDQTGPGTAPLRAVARAEVTGIGQVSVAAGEDARVLSFAAPVPLGGGVGCLRMQSDPATGNVVHDRVALWADQVGCDARDVLDATLSPTEGIEGVVIPGYPGVQPYTGTA